MRPTFGTLAAVFAVALAAVASGAAVLLGGGAGGPDAQVIRGPRDVIVRAEGASAGREPASLPAPDTANGPDIDHEPGEILVADAPDGLIRDAGALGIRAVETLRLGHLGLTVHRLRLPEGTSVSAGIAALRRGFPAAAVDANHRFATAEAGVLPASYARALIGWTDIPEDCGEGVRLGMIDAGVDTAHPALAGADVSHRAFNRWDRRPGPADHGTAIAGLMIGRPTPGKGWGGLLPGAHLSAANIFEINDEGAPVATARSLLGAVDWMIERRVHVVNLSVAGPDNEVVRRAVERALGQGLILVAAAGNWGRADRPAYPAAYDAVIAVTAVSADRRIYSHANRGAYVDFAAPGVRIWTAVPDGGRFQSGTSFASPYVSALAGLAVAAGAARTPNELRTVLREEAVDLGAPGRDDVYGWGLVSAKPSCRETPRREQSLHLEFRRMGENPHQLKQLLADLRIADAVVVVHQLERFAVRHRISLELRHRRLGETVHRLRALIALLAR